MATTADDDARLRADARGDTDAARATGSGGEDSTERKRRRKSRWGDEESKVFLPGVPTSLPSNLTRVEQENFLRQLKLEEVNRKLRTGDVVPPEHERSPSPEPTYDRDGARLNTREKRYRRKLEEERQQLIEESIRKDPNYKPPIDYKKPTKYKEKVYVPQKDFPEINFIGQLIGPRGNTLKKIEREAGGAKIFIRGKGSVKEGKNQNPHPDDNDELHCLVTAESEDKVKAAVSAILEIIEVAKSVPEELNERKKQQLMELAALNGTLRNDDKIICRNCGEMGHRDRECPHGRNITQSMRCSLCGGGGHLRRDCYMNNNPDAARQMGAQPSAMDQEYQSLMKELNDGGSGKAPSNAPSQPSVPTATDGPVTTANTGQWQGWPQQAYQQGGWSQDAWQQQQQQYAAWYGNYYGAAGMYGYQGYSMPATGADGAAVDGAGAVAGAGVGGTQPPPTSSVPPDAPQM